jgi:hypothetical protein
MLGKLIRNLARHARMTPPVDPAQFDDPIATQTEWKPARRGGSSFCTRKLVQKSYHRCKFRPTVGVFIFFLVFFLIGLGIASVFLNAPFLPDNISMGKDTPIIVLFIGIAFALIGVVVLYYSTRPIVFDTQQGYFWKGRHAPSVTSHAERGRNFVSLNQIHAIQLISEYCRGNKTSYYSYEINLILKDASRINVVDHGKLSRIREDAQTLSQFLGIPVWDAT